MTTRFAPASFWLRWTAANAWGELVGLGIVAGLGYVVAIRVGEPRGIAAAVAVAAVLVALGAIEGLVVGLAQAGVLRTAFPALRGWVRSTVAGAAAAWAVGMLPSTVMSVLAQAPAGPPPQVSDAAQLALAAALGLVAGPLLACFQWRRLRRHVKRAWAWLPANGLAWAAGMPVIFHAAHAAATEGDLVTAVTRVAASLLLAGAVVGAIHGAFLAWLIAAASGAASASQAARTTS